MPSQKDVAPNVAQNLVQGSVHLGTGHWKQPIHLGLDHVLWKRLIITQPLLITRPTTSFKMSRNCWRPPPFSKKQKMGSGQCPNLLFGSGYVVKPSGLIPSAHPHRSDWKLSSTPKRGPWPSTKKTTPWMWGASSKRPFCSCATMPGAASPRVRTWEQVVVLSEGYHLRVDLSNLYPHSF